MAEYVLNSNAASVAASTGTYANTAGGTGTPGATDSVAVGPRGNSGTGITAASAASGATSVTLTGTSINLVAGCIIKIAGTTGVYEVRSTGVFGSTGLTFLDSQVDELVYNANAIDGSTCTEFSDDYPNIQIDISDPDGVTSVKRLYAWYHYTVTTADGIRNFFRAMEAPDEANYTIDETVVDLKLDNTSATPVRITEGYLARKDGSTVIAATSGSIQMDPLKAYLANAGSIAAGVWSALTTANNTPGTMGAALQAPGGVSTGSAFNHQATGFTLAAGTVTTGAYTVTAPRDGVLHRIASVDPNIDFTYDFQLAAGDIPTAVTLYAATTGNNDPVFVYGYDFIGSTWVQIGTLTGTAQVHFAETSLALLSHMVSAAGLVRIRFAHTATSTTAVEVDQIFVAYGQPSATAAGILAAAQATPIHADIRKVRGQTVNGTGIEADPWGP